MTFQLFQQARRFLRSPAVITGELAFLTLLSVLGAALPQAGSASASEVTALRAQGPLLRGAVETLALDHLFTSPAFLAACLLATGSLVLVVLEQARRLRASWTTPLQDAQFRRAPFHASFLREPRPGAESRRLWSTGRAGQAGSFLFHTGLLAVIAAAALRGLFGVTAAVDLLEKETLPPTVEAWGAQWPGRLADPFRLDLPLTLDAVDLDWYESGGIRDVAIRFLEPGGPARRLGINEEFRVSRGRIYVNAEVGPAALVAWTQGQGPMKREALLLRQDAPGAFTATTGDRWTLHVRARLAHGSQRPTYLEARVMDGAILRYAGRLEPGQRVPLPLGGSLELAGLPYWARLHGSRDPGLPLVYAGFLLGLAGAAATYLVIRVDHRVLVSPEGPLERVVVEMKPHRFAPLFQERFQRLVRSEGGTP